MTKKRKNKHLGSSFDAYLVEEGLYEEATSVAWKRVLSWEVSEAMKKEGISKSEMAKRMNTSRSQLERLLDPDNPQRPPGDGSKGGRGGRQAHDNQPRGRARILKRASCSKPSVMINRSRRITRAVLSSPLRNRFAASSRSTLADTASR
jgi:antitoxin HicB